MTYEEAIKEAEIQISVYESMILYNKDFEPRNDNSNYERKIEFLKIVIEALKKQIPKKPYIDNDNGVYEKEYCPTCHRSLFPNDIHCKCGQAIDWSDEV